MIRAYEELCKSQHPVYRTGDNMGTQPARSGDNVGMTCAHPVGGKLVEKLFGNLLCRKGNQD